MLSLKQTHALPTEPAWIKHVSLIGNTENWQRQDREKERRTETEDERESEKAETRETKAHSGAQQAEVERK